MATARQFQCGVAKLSPARGRFSIPQGVLSSSKIVGPGSAVNELTVEILDEGHIRLYPRLTLTQRASEEEQSLRDELAGENLIEGLQVLADRYQPCSFSGKDGNRVIIPQAVVTALLPELGTRGQVQIFVQAGEGFIDIMTLPARMARLKRFR